MSKHEEESGSEIDEDQESTAAEDALRPQVKYVAPTEDEEVLKERMLNSWEKDRAELLTWRPFLGILAMNLDLIPVVDHRCKTACTVGRRIFFNPYFLDRLNEDERMTILAHEIWHCGLLHFSREQDRIEDHEMWNFAIDHEVNALLRADGFTLPPRCVLYQRHIGLSAEQIFGKLSTGQLSMRGEILDEHLTAEPSSGDEDENGPDGDYECDSDLDDDCDSDCDGDGDGEKWKKLLKETRKAYGPLINLTDDGVEKKVDKKFRPNRSDQVWKDWRAKMMAAAQQCQGRGHDMGNYEGMLDDLAFSRMPWKEMLRQFLTPIFGGARQWLPPNRRFVTQGIYLPSRRQQELLKIVVVIATSGSTMGPIVESFMSEVNAIINTFGGYEMTLLQIDRHIQDEQTYSMDNPFYPKEFTLTGGGGTAFEPAFEYVDDEMNNDIKVLIYMTDGHGSAPADPPPYPVLWALDENGRMPCDWGAELRIPEQS